MFSNWLTSSSQTAAAAAAAAAANASSQALQSNAPDVILEIGPLPFSRFAAHSAILAAHSGYLRSVLRPDERIVECPIYVPNVTAEHFTPLLTYMYTGFLDLNVENIFGVLLATHVLHMPRALEICRSFLARIQADGYSNSMFFDKLPLSTLQSQPQTQPQAHTSSDAIKVVRPIASKATNSGLAFIAPPVTKPLLGCQDTPFKSLNLKVGMDHTVVSASDEKLVEIIEEKNVNIENDDENMNRESPAPSTSQIVDVDRLTPEPDHIQNDLTLIAKPPEKFRKRTHSRAKSQQSQSVPNERAEREDISKELIGTEKFIVDVASCDGPVRFQRVLNDAYGRFPNKTSSLFTSKSAPQGEHNKVNMTNSFHMQMARNISERQAIDSDRTDSENSEEITVLHHSDDKSSKNDSSKCKSNCSDGASSKFEELYNCVYCKHTFKSQYCYQKHAKRHINPLTIESAIESGDGGGGDADGSGGNGDNVKSENLSIKKCESNSMATPTSSTSQPSSLGIRVKREVRPLDMNVQYYPCKTCGSKFPSYYFVHKHRKLCHANEEN